MSEPDASAQVLYVERWNDLRRKPVKGYSWLSPEEAAERYATRRGDLALVDGTRGDDGEHHPRWVIGVAHNGIRVQFFTPRGGSVWRTVDYDARDERLWRWITAEYTYADDDRFHPEFESVQTYTAKLEPDGTGYVDFNDKSKATVDRARLTDAPVAGFWLDWPEFGHWEDLANPDYGLGDDPGSTLGGRPQ